MEVYNVTIATGTSEYSGTNNYIFVTLVGEKGESERTLLDNPGLDFCRGAVRTLLTWTVGDFTSSVRPLVFFHSRFVQLSKRFSLTFLGEGSVYSAAKRFTAKEGKSLSFISCM